MLPALDGIHRSASLVRRFDMPTPGRDPRIRSRLNALTVALFAGALVAPAIDSFARPGVRANFMDEGRKAAGMPRWAWSPEAVSTFPASFEAWFNDALGLRDKLLRWRNALCVFAFHVSPTDSMVLGRDRWLYYDDLHAIEIARGVRPFAPEELDAWRRALENRRDWCAARGIEYVFAFCPNKSEIYPEHLPSACTRLGPTRCEQLVEHLARRSDLRLVDLAAPLRAERAHDRGGDLVYFPFGTHWTDRGMFAAYRAIVARLQERFPALEPVRGEAVEYALGRDQGDSWPEHKFYLRGLLHQQHWVMASYGRQQWWSVEEIPLGPSSLQTVNEDASRPSILVYHDSFGATMRSLLAQSFSRATFSWEYGFDPRTIARVEPDIVLQLWTERMLGAGIPMLVPDEDENVLRARFEASREVLLALDVRAEPPALESHNGTRLARVADGIEVVTTGALDMALLPAFEFSRRGNAVIAIDVTSPAATTLSVFYKTARESEYKRVNRFAIELAAGRSRKVLELLQPALAGRLLVQFGTEPGRFVLHELEVRGVER